MMALPDPDQDSSAPLLLLQSVEHLALHFVGGLIQTLGPNITKNTVKIAFMKQLENFDALIRYLLQCSEMESSDVLR